MQGEIVSGKNMFAKTKLGKNMTEEHKSEKNKSNQRKSEKNSSEKTKLRNKEHSLQKNDLIMLEITDLTEEGQGVEKGRLGFFRERQRHGRPGRSQDFKGKKELRLCQGGEAFGSISLSHYTPLSRGGKMRRLSATAFIL